MELKEQILFKENQHEYQHLKENSQYIKYLNRGTIDFHIFNKMMKELYKERLTDKLNNVTDNIELINSVLDIFK